MSIINRSELDKAAAEGLLERGQVEPLLAFLKAQQINTPRFDFTHVLYYFGGLVAIGAMTLFMNLGWDRFGGWGIVFICLLYAGIGLLLTNRFRDAGLLIPAEICAAFLVALAPLAIYGVMNGMGIWPGESDYPDYPDYQRRIHALSIYMELGALLVAALMLYRYKFAFLLMPVSITLWYMSIDIYELMSAAPGAITVSEYGQISMWSGILMILGALYVDIRAQRKIDFAFWLYVGGVFAFWGGLNAQESDLELAKFLYFLINLGLIAIGVILVRKVFVVLGAVGSAVYFSHLASGIFEDSWLFPIALTFIGLAIIYLGVVWQKNEILITQKLRSYLPATLRNLLENSFV